MASSPGMDDISLVDDYTTLSNFRATGSQNTIDVLPLLTTMTFRSHDPIVDKLLTDHLPGVHDSDLIKTKDNEFHNTIIANLRRYITEMIFSATSVDSSIRQMFTSNLHFGATNDPDDGSRITHDRQLRGTIKQCDLEQSDGQLIIWVRHTLFFPTAFQPDRDWTTVQTQEQVTPARQARVWNNRRNPIDSSKAPVPETVTTPAPSPAPSPPAPQPLSRQVRPPTPVPTAAIHTTNTTATATTTAIVQAATPTAATDATANPPTAAPRPPATATASPMTHQQFQGLLQSQIAMQTTIADLATIATNLIQSQSTTTGPSTGIGTGPPPDLYVNSNQSNAIFYRPALPIDVLARYDTRTRPLTKDKVTPFSTGDYFHHDPTRGTGNNLTIVTTGHILYHDYSSKEFRKSTPTCTGTSTEYLRSYYAELYEVCMNKGIYVPHYFLLRYQPMTRQSLIGFEFGSGKDLPLQLEIRVPSWSGDILYALRKAFPDRSRFHQIAHMERDGYSALNMIFGENHPNLDPIPLSLTDTPPLQTERQNIYQFWMKYQDYLQLKSWVENNEKDLNTQEQVALFITKCQHSAYLRREITADHRNDPNAFITRYTGTRLPTTIQQLLDTAKFRDGSLQPLRLHDNITSTAPQPRERDREAPAARSGPTHGRNRSGPSYRIRQLIQADTTDEPLGYESDDSVELKYVHAVFRQAKNLQKRTPYCILCHKKDHYFNACPTIDPKDTKLHLKLQLQINDLLNNIQKKGADNVIPVNEMQLIDTDTPEDHPQSDLSPDFRGGSP
jgi:hypothetical protein